VLVPGGAITAIEVDYSTCRAEPSTSAFEALVTAMVRGMAASGWSDAGTRVADWLREAGFRDVAVRATAIAQRYPSTAEAVRYLRESTPLLREPLAELTDAERGEVWSEVERELRRFAGGDGFEAPGEVLIGVGTK
jgi:hypothetical protein